MMGLRTGDGSAPDRHRFYLSFLDPDTEERYSEEIAGRLRPQLRISAIWGALLWLVALVIADRVVGVEPAIAYGICLGMAVVNLAGWGLSYRFTRPADFQVITLVFGFTAVVAASILFAISDTFEQYGAPTVMLVATFAFVQLQLRFVLAVPAAVFYMVVFLAFSLGTESGETLAQGFLVLAALATGVQGVRALEISARDRFAQRNQISALSFQVESLLRTYLSPSVAEVMLADPTVSDLGGRVAEVSVLFADLEGFTPMSRVMSPAEVASVLNRYFEVVVPTVIAEGGSVLSFGGDAILAVFNAPKPFPDHALRAARAALRIQSEILRLRAELGLAEAPLFRIGVNTGEALVGNIGSDETRTFTVIGDAVNLASRLQTHATPGSVVMGPATYELIRDSVRASALEPVVLKGMVEPVQPYQLEGLG